MTLVIPPGYAEASVEMRGAGDPDPWYCTFGIVFPGGEISGLEAAAEVYDAWMDSFGGNLNTTTACTGVRLRIGQDGGDPVVVNYVGTQSGGTPGERLPQNCALLISKSTNLGGRKGKGRMYVPNILKETSVSETGVITTDSMESFVIVADTFLSSLLLAEVPMVLLHNEYTPQPEPTVVTALTPQGVIATQRRRLR